MTPNPATQNTRELSPEAQAAAAWFRQLARALRVFRLYHRANPNALAAEESVTSALTDLLATQGDWRLRFSATEILLDEEVVVRVSPPGPGGERVKSVTDTLPFLFFRDGLRRLTLAARTPRAEVDVLIQSLLETASGTDRQDDLVTLLWQANLTHIRLEAVPLEQTIYLSSQAAGGPENAIGRRRGQVFAWSPVGGEIHAELGQAAGAQGLHRDTFDDWALPAEAADVPEAFSRLAPPAEAAHADFLADWERERATPWNEDAALLVRTLHALDPSVDTRRALGLAVVTWLATALQQMEWVDGRRALGLLDELDPGHALVHEELTAALGGLDAAAIAERFDEGDASDQAAFAAFVVALGPPAVGLCVDVMARAEKARARAATTTALCYLCAEAPQLLAPWIADPRWHVVRNILFVLGHIGGPDIVPLLRFASRHPEPRVRRQLVSALGAVPPEDRTPLLLEQLDARDPQLLAAALNMLTRDKGPRVARAVLAVVRSPEFETRDEDNQRTVLHALGELGGDPEVPVLEELLHRGGRFARRTFLRTAIARTLLRIGTPTAMAALQAGVSARSEAVRAACLEALGARGRP